MSYPSTTSAPPPRAALLAGLRGQTPPSAGGRAPASGGYPRLPPHTPQHRQRFPSSEHTLGPSFDDDAEDEEMIAKMAALNAGVYPQYQQQHHQQQQQQGGGGASRMVPRGQIDNGGPPMGVHRMQQGGQAGNGRRLGMGGGDANHPSSINYQQQQQQMQQQELLRVLTMQTLANNQGPRNMEELQLLQALAQQHQQREMEQQVEQLLRMQVQQQAQQLQQQLLVQQQQAAMLAQQQQQQHPNNRNNNQPGPPPSASFNQRSFEQSYAHAQQQVQQAQQAQRVQQTPQQLASAYEQRHQAQQQIQANLRARSGVPPLPTPAAVAASGHRFGFELDPPRDDIHGQGIFANPPGPGLGPRPTSQPRGLSPQPGAGAVGERAQASPGPGGRVSSPLEGGPFGGLNLGGQRDPYEPESDARETTPLGAASSVWAAGKSDVSGNWRTKSTESPPPTHPRSVSAGVVAPAVSRFSGTFSPPAGHAREASAPIGRLQAHHLLDNDGRSESSSHPSRPNSNSDDNDGSRSPTSSEGVQTAYPPTNGRPTPDMLKPIYEGIGLGRPYPNQHQQQDKPSSPTPPSTGYGGGRSLSMAAAAAALNSHPLEPTQQQQQQSPYAQRATPPIDSQARTRGYDLAGAGQAPVNGNNGNNNNNGSNWGSNVTRQPRGPPSPADELGARNFASRLRRKAGSNLSVLGRREQSASPSH